eukprot:gnl/TRDRNA2_/TRDRNA2_179882_c0_seq1.p1 gnl/TRDRNA2_/TRDRNA2_179882_c0~~gnl/TRDRNA2_/TRDRNA2_179882_c0_seq1.p1  ORF type:complete len:379 (-),score=79.08 gnl/TRDRNA2_/TRDRNA2_179882_c0_seq1:105-1241(-)
MRWWLHTILSKHPGSSKPGPRHLGVCWSDPSVCSFSVEFSPPRHRNCKMVARCLLGLVVFAVSASVAGAALGQSRSSLRQVQLNSKDNSTLVTLGAAGPAPAGSPAAAPSPPVGLCGCVKTNQCTCGGSLDYLQCVHEACDAGCGDCESLSGPWTDQCQEMMGTCADTIDIACHDTEATCEGKFHQAQYGVTGLSLELAHLSEEAFCGPYGKCIGELHLSANVLEASDGMVMECVVPVSHDDPEDVYYCNNEIVDGTAKCTLPMLKKLDKGSKVEGHCYILDKQHYQITKDAFFAVQNRFDDNFAADSKKELKKEAGEKEMKKEKKLKKKKKQKLFGGGAKLPDLDIKSLGEKSKAAYHPRFFGLASMVAGLTALYTC